MRPWRGPSSLVKVGLGRGLAVLLCGLILALGLSAGGASEPAAPRLVAAQSPAVLRGQALHQSRCSGCHAVDANDIGPLHRGVLGRPAGTVPGFDYSPALRASRLVWTRQTLDAWLRDPEALVPGQGMDEQVLDAQDRQDLIAYLATLL